MTRIASLRPREKAVLTAIAEAKPNKQIAYELRITEGTVKVYVVTLLAKLGGGNRVALANLYRSCMPPTLDTIRTGIMSSEFTVAEARELLILLLDRSHGSKKLPEAA